MPGSTFGVRRSRVIVNLAAIRANYRGLLDLAGGRSVLYCVVKANAYGHGAVAVARTLLSAGARLFAVASVDEAVELRSSGVTGSILVLNGLSPGEEPEALNSGIEPLIGSLDQLGRWNRTARRAGRRLPCQLLLNTGMNRLGLDENSLSDDARSPLLERLQACDAVEVRGVATHYISSEDFDTNRTEGQDQAFGLQLARLKAAGVVPRYVHAANSAALAFRAGGRSWDGSGLTAARPGLGLYGYLKRPSSPVHREAPVLRPALEWRARVCGLHDVPRGATVGYGATYTAERDTRIGVLSVGYADGLDWRLSNRGSVSLRGVCCPFVGEISMDLTTVDFSACRDVRVGDEVTLMGPAKPYDAPGMAGLAGSTAYEVLCGIAARVPRQYVDQAIA